MVGISSLSSALRICGDCVKPFCVPREGLRIMSLLDFCSEDEELLGVFDVVSRNCRQGSHFQGIFKISLRNPLYIIFLFILSFFFSLSFLSVFRFLCAPYKRPQRFFLSQSLFDACFLGGILIFFPFFFPFHSCLFCENLISSLFKLNLIFDSLPFAFLPFPLLVFPSLSYSITDFIFLCDSFLSFIQSSFSFVFFLLILLL